ncbi:MAG: ABC transporter permease [Dehalococcoidia bacterium]|nr:ABC transporter permease [Dehalococcoidia bacterium]MDH4367839.1 ABC transporter permease [Dehalococcoidia bacterium]
MRAIGIRRIIDPLPIYTMWLREMKRFLRVKARVVGSLLMPLFFLAFLGLPMSFMPARQIPGLEGIGYLDFLAPGIVGMTLLFAGTMSGASVIWDKEFGFLKEVLVAPVSRFSVILGRSLGGMTTAIIQALVIVGIAVAMGVTLSSVPGFLLAIVIMILTCATFTGFGLIIATKLGNLEGFMAIMNLIVFPIFFLSGALFPVQSMPSWLRYIMYVDPLTYGVDGLRGTLIGISAFPLWLDFTVLLILCLALATLGSYFFSKMEAD